MSPENEQATNKSDEPKVRVVVSVLPKPLLKWTALASEVRVEGDGWLCEGAGPRLLCWAQEGRGERVHATTKLSLAGGSRSGKEPPVVLFCSPNEWLVEKIFPKAQPGLTW